MATLEIENCNTEIELFFLLTEKRTRKPVTNSRDAIETTPDQRRPKTNECLNDFGN